jgi:hypothetical protein
MNNINANIFILNGVLGMEGLLGKPTFIWKGETFACIANSINDQEAATDAGFKETTDFRMTVRLNQFTPNIYPAINDYITYLGYSLLIKEIKKPTHGVYWIYMCDLATI